jgi:hypothetical protein
MEQGIGLAILGSALGSAKILEKILGPTAEYIGGGIQSWTEQRVKNVSNIFACTQKKIGDKIEEPGAIPPRVLKVVLDEGSFCSDPLAAEYFGGVLASSRSQVTRDDRGASWLSLVARLSSYEVRSHYVFYRSIYDRFLGQDFKFNLEDRGKLEVLMPFSSYFAAMEFTQDEMKYIDSILNHAFFGLYKEGLIETFVYGNAENLKTQRPDKFEPPEEGGILATPSALGCELFLWAHGYGSYSLGSILKLQFDIPVGMTPCHTVWSQEDLKPKKSEQDATDEVDNSHL